MGSEPEGNLKKKIKGDHNFQPCFPQEEKQNLETYKPAHVSAFHTASTLSVPSKLIFLSGIHRYNHELSLVDEWGGRGGTRKKQ